MNWRDIRIIRSSNFNDSGAFTEGMHYAFGGKVKVDNLRRYWPLSTSSSTPQ